MLLEQPNIKYLSTLTHEGKLVLMATIVENGAARLYYAVKQDGFEDNALQNPNGNGWEAFKLLELPNDSAGDPSVAAKEQAELTDKQGKYLLQSLYTSADLTADAPVQLVSHDGHLYVYRQSMRGTLLVDRFVLDGIANTLTPKLEVRYKRSRQRYAPLKAMKITSGGQMESVDSLDFRDMQNQPFSEPTTEVCPQLLNSLHDGWFGVVVAPTNEQDGYRWHIFAHNSSTGKIDLVTLRAGDNRIFDVQDNWFRTADPITEATQYSSIPGIIRRRLALQTSAGQALSVTGGLAATTYDVQREQQTQGGPQLMRESGKVLLAAPTTAGTAALSFSIAADGRLAQIAATSQDELQRSQEREILLPADLLDNIRPVGDSSDTPAGTIAGMSRSNGDDSADRVRVVVAEGDQAAVSKLTSGDTVKLSNTTSYNGLYSVAKADDGSFVIGAPFSYGEIGDWEKMEVEETGLIFDGMLTGYEKTRDGKLKVYAVNHGLAAGDLVQIVGDDDYGGEYPVLKHDDDSFTVERLWAGGEAVNVKLESRKRRGLVLDGKRDWISAPISRTINLSSGFTVEAWVKLASAADQTILVLQSELQPDGKQADAANATAATLALKDGLFTISVTRPLLGRTSALRIASDTPAPLDKWVHVACSFNDKELHLLEDGAVKASVTAEELDRKAKVAQDAVIKQLEQDVAAMPAGSDADAARAALDALKDRLKQVPPAFSMRVSTIYLGAAPQLKSGSTQPINFLRGQMADVRLWTAGRSDKAIVDTMHLQLTGRETGLAGYWRLGGIAVEEDGARRVFDFSVNANHGNVQGAPYAGGVTLGRTLRDGKTAAVKFSNDDLFAVREGAIYVERFEFRTDKPVDAKNADGKNTPIFTPSLWGRLSRASQEKQTFTPMQETYEFETLTEGWQATTCRFLVPEGVRLLRCFEAANVAGDWATLEVRRHTLKLVSDTVTLSTLDETSRLPLLANSLDNPAQPADLLGELAGKEDEEASLVTRQKELERLLADSANLSEIKRQRDTQQALVDRLRGEEASKQSEYDRAATDPLNFWCTLTPKDTPSRGVTGNVATHVIFQSNIDQLSPLQIVNQLWKFEPVETSGSYTWYKITNKFTDKCADVDPDGHGIHQVSYLGNDNQQWRLEYLDDGYLKIVNRRFNEVFDARRDNNGVRALGWHGGDNQRWKLAFGDQAISDKPNTAHTALENARNQRVLAEAELTRLNTAFNASDSQRAAWQKELTEIQAKLPPIRERIAVLTTSYLVLITRANTTAQAMPDLPGQKDPRGLLVQGALLPFARPAGRLHALESCTGRVTLSYQDSDGNLRQIHYDTAYDADGKGEEWLPDGYRAALALDGRGSALPLPAGVFDDLSSQVTVEFWARGGSDLPKAAFFLAALDGGSNRCLSIQLPNEKGEVVWEAGQPANGALDSLVKAADATLYRGYWNHWAFVKDAAAGEMRIYVNGKLWVKNNPKAKEGDGPRNQLLGGISQAALGGLPEQMGDWQGQVCELRIWNAALGEREIEANSVLTPSGNEPGLVAYYPFNEAQGDQGRDHTGRGHHIATGGAAWAACTAPIGRILAIPEGNAPVTLLSRPRTFNGSGDFVQLPALNPDLTNGLTIEARVTYQSFKTWSRIVDLGNGQGKHNIVLANRGDSKRLVLVIFGEQETTRSELAAPTDLEPGRLTHLTATIAPDGMARLYIDGDEVASGKVTPPLSVLRTSNYIGRSNWPGGPFFHGQMDYVRLYTSALDAEAIKELAQNAKVALTCAEYSRVRVDAQRRKSVMMLRCLALPAGKGVRLLDEQRIEELEMTWIGNAQINPTLIGYIEGPPPAPSENLTEEQDYNGATSVELIQSSDVEFSWTREGDIGGGAEAEVLIGAKSQSSAGIGFQTSVEEVKTGLGGKLDFAYHWQNASTVGASHSLMSSDRLELRGSQEPEAHFPHLGKRFIPKNIGYALVSSGLADVFVSKLKRSGRMIGYQQLPVEGVPLDVNTITFLINPAYTMSGSLDGLTGSRATSDRFFRHVPEMRSQFGSLYPASYFRLKEAYDLKNQIDQQDKAHEAYFNQFDARLLDVWSLDRQVDDASLDGNPVGLNSPDRRGDGKEQAAQIKTREAELEKLKNAKPFDQAAVDAKQKELDALREQETKRKEQGQSQRKQAGKDREDKINSTYTDLSARANASDSFAAWQKKMETLQIRAGKRNIVNTYVWDGDGGFHAEEQQFASTVEHSVGGSFDMSAAIGGQGSYAFSKALVEFNAYAKFNLTQTMSKTERGSKGLELHVDLSGVESRGITDYRDYPLLPGEKVDRYRFMSFFLENNTDHWHDFFNYVVDPEWLASNDEEARALREAQNALPNKVWRVLHRVTHVERPALMGFGRRAVKKNEAADDIRSMRDQITDLQGKVAALQKEINEKLDQLLVRKT